MNRLPKWGVLIVALYSCMGCMPPSSPEEPGSPWIWETLAGALAGISFRGFTTVDDSVFWASGSRGTILLTVDGGSSWLSRNPPGNGHRDFRAIYAWSAAQAVALAVGDTGLILRTTDGGMNWDTAYLDPSPGVFLDDLDFDGPNGWAFGDPLERGLYLLTSRDSGQSWSRVNPSSLPEPAGNEGAFAASGTNLVAQAGLVGIVTGAGRWPRFIYQNQETWQAVRVPLQAGPLAGAYSVAFRDSLWGMAVGGNFQDSLRRDSVACLTMDGGHHWQLVDQQHGPRGYRSCVIWHDQWKCWFAIGRTGLDYSVDGIHWEPVHQQPGFYVCMPTRHALWCVGRNGQLGKLTSAALTTGKERI